MTQPYAALLMIVPGQLLLYLRWLYRPTPKMALLYVGFAVASAYICTFSILLMVAQIMYLLIFMKDGWHQRSILTRYCKVA